ncbi:hypothetical protein [Methylocella sp.]|uniref:hypothetical protein n=1 Tax=Methylocella sp. TaxID=1978226 RepID=UPI0035B0D1B7
MFVALGFLLGSLALSVASSFLDATILPTLIPLFVAAGLAIVAVNVPTQEAERFSALVRPVALCAIVPAVWMLLQMAPLPFPGLVHPVWRSVAAAFPHPPAGAISVDIGATTLALARYAALVGALLLTTALTVNRERAETVLAALAGATTLCAALVIALDLFGAPTAAVREEATSAACLGVVLNAALACFVFERHETRRAKLGFSTAKFLYPMAATIVAFAICVAAIGRAWSGSLSFAAACGFSAFAAIFIVRRLNLGRWGAGALAVTGAVIVFALITGAIDAESDARLTFVRKDAATIDLTRRILADTPPAGAGAGAFASLAPIYRSASPDVADLRAATAAAQLSIELGRPALWASLAAALAGAAALVRAAARRGRDSFFPAAAAASLLTLIVLAFINVSLFAPALPFLAAVICGLGLAQSQQSRSSA